MKELEEKRAKAAAEEEDEKSHGEHVHLKHITPYPTQITQRFLDDLMLQCEIHEDR